MGWKDGEAKKYHLEEVVRSALFLVRFLSIYSCVLFLIFIMHLMSEIRRRYDLLMQHKQDLAVIMTSEQVRFPE